MKRFLGYVLLLACLFGLVGCQEDEQPETKAEFAQPENCSVHFLSCGKADAILLLADGEAMLVDAGYAANASQVVAYLKAQGVTKLRYLVLTHGDKDHVGGMAEVLENFAVEQLLISPRKEASAEYNAMAEAAQKRSVAVTVPEVGSSFAFGKGSFTVLAPGEEALAEDSDNDSSLVLQYFYGNRSFLLMGDALSTTEKEMRENGLAKVCDVLKVGHHGKDDASKKKFLKAVAPLYAVISCGDIVGEDEEGTPDEAVLSNLTELGIEILRTDLLGTIVFDTDGTELTLRESE
ncbi:MAG: MBL fold metallo-hydrolase [Lachnospiraceae bacterium]|nr:MBL fold metallo-hydrolase [Lachnospiraceae bacterium]